MEKLKILEPSIQRHFCCGQEMLAVGLGDSNGWECMICHKQEEDIASWKMANRDE